MKIDKNVEFTALHVMFLGTSNFSVLQVTAIIDINVAYTTAPAYTYIVIKHIVYCFQELLVLKTRYIMDGYF